MSDSRKSTVVVTGSSGLIGFHLCRTLAKQYSVVALDIEPPNEEIDDVFWTKCDMTSDSSVSSAFQNVRNTHGECLTSVVHLAAYYDFAGEPSPLYDELTVEGTRRLLRELQRFDVGQFVFSSTLLVMKPVDEHQMITEESATEAQWDYPKSKLAAEEVIAKERGKIPAVILRIAGVYDEDCHSIPIAQQIARIYEQSLESYFYPGDSQHGQPFVHLDDLVECIRRVIARRSKLAPLEVFLIAEEELQSYEQLQNRIGVLIHGAKWDTIRIPKFVAKAGAWIKDQIGTEEEFIKPWMIDLADDHYPVSIAKARQQLDWQPNHRLSESLETMIGRLLYDPERWYKINGLGQPPQEKLGVVIVDPLGNQLREGKDEH